MVWLEPRADCVGCGGRTEAPARTSVGLCLQCFWQKKMANKMINDQCQKNDQKKEGMTPFEHNNVDNVNEKLNTLVPHLRKKTNTF